MNMIRFLLAAILLLASPALAQQGMKGTNAVPTKITTGLTYQLVLASGAGTGAYRNSLTIQNNNTTDSCWIILGGPWVAGDTTASSRSVNGVSLTALQASIVLLPAGSYTRYYPWVPSDPILATCTTTADSIYVDTQ